MPTAKASDLPLGVPAAYRLDLNAYQPGKGDYPFKTSKPRLIPFSIFSDVVINCSEDVQKNKCQHPIIL